MNRGRGRRERSSLTGTPTENNYFLSICSDVPVQCEGNYGSVMCGEHVMENNKNEEGKEEKKMK